MSNNFSNLINGTWEGGLTAETIIQSRLRATFEVTADKMVVGTWHEELKSQFADMVYHSSLVGSFDGQTLVVRELRNDDLECEIEAALTDAGKALTGKWREARGQWYPLQLRRVDDRRDATVTPIINDKLALAV